MYQRFLLVLLAASTSSVQSHECPDTGEHRLLPHEDCARYYQCEYRHKVVRDCAPGTHFDYQLQICNWPHLVDCHQGRTEPAQPILTNSGPQAVSRDDGSKLPNGCPADFGVQLLLPHETECAKFYSCSNGRKYLMSCGAGTVFDVHGQICNWPYLVNCDRGSTTTVSSSSEAPITKTTGPVMTPTSIVDKPTTVPTNVDHAVPNDGTNKLPNGCPVDYNIQLLVPHEYDCGSFYSCSNGMRILLNCPGGTLFDVKEQICNWPHLVNCPVTTTTSSTTSAPLTTTTTTSTKTPFTTVKDTTISEAPATISGSEAPSTNNPTSSSSQKPTTLEQTTKDSFKTTSIVEVESSTTSIPEAIATEIPTSNTADATATESPKTTNSDATATESPKTTNLDAVSTDSPTTTSSDAITTDSPSTITLDEVTTDSPTTTSTDAITTDSPTTTSTDAITTDSPTTTSTDAVTTDSPTTTSTDAVTTNSPTTTTPDEVTTDSLTTTSSDVINTDSPTTTNTDAVTTNNPTTTSLDAITTDSPSTTSTEIVTTDNPATTSPDEETTDSPTTTTPEEVTTNISTTTSPGEMTTDNISTTNPDEITTDSLTTTKSPTTTSTDKVTTDSPTTKSTDEVTTDVPTTTSTDAVTTDSPITTSTDAVTTDSPTTISTDVVTTDSPITTSTDAVTTDSPTTTSLDAVNTNSPTTKSTDVVTTDSPTTTSADAVSTDSLTTTSPSEVTTNGPTTTTPNIETTDSSTTSTLNIETTDNPTTTTPNIETTDSPKTTTPDIETTNSPSTTSPEATTLTDGENNVSVDITTASVATTESNLDITTVAATVETTADVTTDKASTEDNFDITQSTTDTETTHNLPTTESATSEWNAETKTTVVDLGTTNSETGTAQITTVEYTEITKPSTAEETTTAESVSTESSNLVSTTKDVESVTSDSEQSLTTVTDGTTASVAPPPICSPGTFGNVPHPELCNSFYMCAGGNAIQLFCTEGFEFDPELRSCVAISPGGCTLGSITTWLPDASTDGSTDRTQSTTVRPTTEADKDETQSTISDKVTTTIDVEIDQTTSDATESVTDKTTELPDLVTTTKEVELTTSSTEQPLTTVTDGTTVSVAPPPICPPGWFGNVPHPELCNSFYMCAGGNAIQLFCTEGFEFDPELRSCVAISPGGCTLGSITTWLPDASTDGSTDRTQSTTVRPTTEADKDETQSTISDKVTTTIDVEIDQTTSDATESVTDKTTELPDLVTTTKEVELTTSSTEQSLTTVTDGTTVSVAPPPICPPGWFGNVPHPELCNSFYMCAGGNAIQLFCTEGFEFDPELRSCVAISPGGCTLGSMTTWLPDASTDKNTDITQSTTVRPTTEADKEETQSTISDKVTTTIDVEIDQTTSDATESVTDKTTELPDLVTTTKEVELTTSSTEQSLTTVTDGTTVSVAPPPLCPPGWFGNVPHPELCNSFYMCAGGNAIQLFCTEGFEFDPELRSCVAISPGGCTLGSITTWLPDASTDGSTDRTQSTTVRPTTEADKDETQSTISDKVTTTIDVEIDQTTSDATESVTDKTTELPDLVTTTKEVELTTSSTEQSLTTVTDGTTVSVAPPPLCPPGWFGNVPHPELCNSFYMCAGGNAIQLFCTEGFEFDPELRSCVAITPEGCTLGSITTWLPDASTDGSTDRTQSTTVRPTTEADKDETQSTISDKVTTTIDVEIDQTTSDATESVTDKTTELPDLVTTTKEVELTTSSTEQPLTTVTDGTTVSVAPPPICPPGWFGNVLHPELCNSFYMCAGGNAIQLFCTEGFEFDPELRSCVAISPGGCTLGSITTWLPDASTDGSTDITQSVTDKYTTDITVEVDRTTTENSIGTTESLTDKTTESSDIVSTTKEVELTTVSVGPPPICSPGTIGNVPHPELCNSYYMCAEGNAIQLFCPGGFEYDPVSWSCVPISPGGCTLGSITTSLPDVSTILGVSTTRSEQAETEPTTLEGSTITETVTDKNTTPFVATTESITTEIDKDITQTTISDIGTTLSEDDTEQTTSGINTESTAVASTESSDVVSTTVIESTTSSTTATALPPIICPSGTFGNVPHPELCNSFYMCAGGTAIQLFCTEGFEFDSVLRSCVAIAPGGCTLGLFTKRTKREARTVPAAAEMITGSVLATSTICPKGTFSNVPHASMCHSFYMCADGVMNQFYCSQGYEFDLHTKMCELISASKSRCSNNDNIMSNEVETTGLPLCSPGDSGKKPHPQKCNLYYKCSNGNAVEYLCNSGFEFDTNSEECTPISQNSCSSRK